MRSLLRKLLLNNWLRKLISLIIAVVIWIIVDQSLSVTKTVDTATIRIHNLPPGKTVHNLLQTGVLNKRIPITLTGQKRYITDITPSDFEVVLSLPENITDECIIHVGKEHLCSKNPYLSIETHIGRVTSEQITLKLLPTITEKIPVFIDCPTGDLPEGFEFFNIWPYHLNTTVSGPAEIVQSLKSKGLDLNLDMNLIKNRLDEEKSKHPGNDIVTFYIPDAWKRIAVPNLSDVIQIDDPDAKLLRINFIRSDNVPVEFPIPLYIFSSSPFAFSTNPNTKKILDNEIVQTIKGIKCLNKKLYTKGVSRKFLQIVESMISIFIDISPDSGETSLNWLIQFINYSALEETYVKEILKEENNDDIQNIPQNLRDKYVRTRFRNYVKNFKLFSRETEKPFELDIRNKGKDITIKESFNS